MVSGDDVKVTSPCEVGEQEVPCGGDEDEVSNGAGREARASGLKARRYLLFLSVSLPLPPILTLSLFSSTDVTFLPEGVIVGLEDNIKFLSNGRRPQVI